MGAACLMESDVAIWWPCEIRGPTGRRRGFNEFVFVGERPVGDFLQTAEGFNRASPCGHAIVRHSREFRGIERIGWQNGREQRTHPLELEPLQIDARERSRWWSVCGHWPIMARQGSEYPERERFVAVPAD